MARSPSILHLIHSGAVGGGPRIVLSLATGAPGEHTIASADDGPLLAEARRQGLRTLRLPFAGEFSFAASLPLIFRWCRDADIVHLHGQFAAFYGAMAARAAGTPAIYTAHFPSFITDSNPRNRLRNRLAEWLPCRLVERVVACSETSRAEYVSRRLVPPERITTIYNGVEAWPQEHDPDRLRAELRLRPDDSIVLAMGRFTDQKGFDLLLAAVPSLLASVPKAKVILVGDGEQRPALEQQARRLGVAAAVRFPGFRRDTADFLALASVVAVPSRYDVFPLVPLEAMMASRPVVASDLPVFGEAIADGVTGVLVRPDPQLFGVALSRLLLDGARAQSMGERAQDMARSRFGVDSMIRRYVELYQCLSGERR